MLNLDNSLIIREMLCTQQREKEKGEKSIICN